LLALLLTATGVVVVVEACEPRPSVGVVSTISVCFCMVYLLRRGGPASTTKNRPSGATAPQPVSQLTPPEV
jgi:hypothetical protein